MLYFFYVFDDVPKNKRQTTGSMGNAAGKDHSPL
jgi:hypothetical protein